jgi:hypothetical protein
MAVDARPAPEPQPLPPARVVRRRRPAVQWNEIATWILMALFVVVVGWRALACLWCRNRPHGLHRMHRG